MITFGDTAPLSLFIKIELQTSTDDVVHTNPLVFGLLQSDAVLSSQSASMGLPSSRERRQVLSGATVFF